VLALVSGSLGCPRAPGPEICPRVEPGELVISELRGNNGTSDEIGQYIEIYNAADRTVDLQGVWINQIGQNGARHELLIRDSLKIAAGGYAAIGTGLERPKVWIDYAITPSTELIRHTAGTVEIESCDELIDFVDYDPNTIPSAGTLACGSASTPPDADANDLVGSGCWCVDAEPPEPGSPFPGIGLPGTPGGANRCSG